MKKLFTFAFLISFFYLFSGLQPVQAQNSQSACNDQCRFITDTVQRQQCITGCMNEPAGGTRNTEGGLTNPVIGNLGDDPIAAEEGSTFQRYLIVIWQAIINIGGLAVIIMFLWGAIEWITAGGDSSKVGKARDKITQSIIGLVVLVGSFVIISYIGQVFFGGEFDLLRISLPSF